MDSSHVLCFIIYGLRAVIQTNHDALANKGATGKKTTKHCKAFHSITFTNEWMNIYMYEFLSLHCHHPTHQSNAPPCYCSIQEVPLFFFPHLSFHGNWVACTISWSAPEPEVIYIWFNFSWNKFDRSGTMVDGWHSGQLIIATILCMPTT